MSAARHPWLVLGPSYRWGADGRESAPVVQKYAGAGFVASFLADPRASLAYTAVDEVQRSEAIGGAPPVDDQGRRLRLSERRQVATGLRKLFQPTHNRFYLVVCELCCDTAGLPAVAAASGARLGFVVRRRRQGAPSELTVAARPLVEKVLALEAAQAAIITREARSPCAPDHPRRARRAREMARIEAEVEAVRDELRGLAARYDVTDRLEGWIPSEHPGIGGWVPVDERPEALTEQLTPLYRLTPDPRATGHVGQKRAIYFGTVPTTANDTDETGVPRFDARTDYEIRCVAVRPGHRPGCPDELVWSAATAVYRIAPDMDLDGTENWPVTVELPDLGQLEAAASGRCRGNVRFVAPNAASALDFNVVGQSGVPFDLGASIEPVSFSLSIPLVTIVARFVLMLFLPIVMLLFGLGFLLRFQTGFGGRLPGGSLSNLIFGGVRFAPGALDCPRGKPTLTEDLRREGEP